MRYCRCEHPESYHASRPLYYGAKEMGTGCAFCACSAFEPGPEPALPWSANQEPGYSARRAALGLPPMF